MKKIICKVEYDTETATVLHKKTVGEFGDPAGYEETLMETPDGKFFVYGVGGAESPYAEASIARLGKAKVDSWIAEH